MFTFKRDGISRYVGQSGQFNTAIVSAHRDDAMGESEKITEWVAILFFKGEPTQSTTKPTRKAAMAWCNNGGWE